MATLTLLLLTGTLAKRWVRRQLAVRSMPSLNFSLYILNAISQGVMINDGHPQATEL